MLIWLVVGFVFSVHYSITVPEISNSSLILSLILPFGFPVWFSSGRICVLKVLHWQPTILLEFHCCGGDKGSRNTNFMVKPQSFWEQCLWAVCRLHKCFCSSIAL